jgi:hypothetical protein
MKFERAVISWSLVMASFSVWFGLVIWRKEKATKPRRHQGQARKTLVDFSPLRRRGKIV